MKTITNIKPLLILALVLLLSSNQNIAQNVGIGSESFTPDPSAMLEVKATDKGMLVPRVDIADLATAAPVTNPAVSLLVYNTNETTGEGFYYWSGSEWVAIGGSGYQCNIPPKPLAGNSVVTYNKIIWNWIPGSDELCFFKYNTVNDYNTSINIVGNNSLIMENLNCEQTYSIYVWAYNACGSSSPITLTFTTSECPCGVKTVTFTYKGSPVTYGTALGANNRCWLDRNLGATQVATYSTDANAYGDLFQWGRIDDGHQIRNPLSGTTTTLSNTDQPGHDNFIITGYNSPYDWRSPQNSNLWQGVNGINNPCPTGWRIPTVAEWNTERLSWIPDINPSGAINSPLKLTLAGHRTMYNGTLGTVNSDGYYWASNVAGILAGYFYMYGGEANTATDRARADSFSVRCIKD